MKPESDCGNTREGGCARLESGTAFTPGISEKRLEKAARREKDKCAKFRLLACLGQEEGPQHTQDIQGSENRLLDYTRLAAADARPRTEEQVQREAQGAKGRAPPPDHPYRAAPAQEEPEKVWL